MWLPQAIEASVKTTKAHPMRRGRTRAATAEYALMAQNVVLTLINIFGIYLMADLEGEGLSAITSGQDRDLPRACRDQRTAVTG